MVFQRRKPLGTVYAPVAFLFLLALGTGLLVSCGSDAGGGGEAAETTELEATVTLGPTDGHHLPPTDLERVAVGTMAPDFSLPSLAGDTFTLSSFRGEKNVVLVFYRGHW
jgi:cytochrome oxidase Cu insertion factor (SCO1/SenC/PrrC family)